jgi:hypothetical protein
MAESWRPAYAVKEVRTAAPLSLSAEWGLFQFVDYGFLPPVGPFLGTGFCAVDIPSH